MGTQLETETGTQLEKYSCTGESAGRPPPASGWPGHDLLSGIPRAAPHTRASDTPGPAVLSAFREAQTVGAEGTITRPHALAGPRALCGSPGLSGIADTIVRDPKRIRKKHMLPGFLWPMVRGVSHDAVFYPHCAYNDASASNFWILT